MTRGELTAGTAGQIPPEKEEEARSPAELSKIQMPADAVLLEGKQSKSCMEPWRSSAEGEAKLCSLGETPLAKNLFDNFVGKKRKENQGKTILHWPRGYPALPQLYTVY